MITTKCQYYEKCVRTSQETVEWHCTLAAVHWTGAAANDVDNGQKLPPEEVWY